MTSPRTVNRDEAIQAAAILGAACSGASAPATRSECRRGGSRSGWMPLLGSVTGTKRRLPSRARRPRVNRVCSVSHMGWCGISALRVEDAAVGVLQ